MSLLSKRCVACEGGMSLPSVPCHVWCVEEACLLCQGAVSHMKEACLFCQRVMFLCAKGMFDIC